MDVNNGCYHRIFVGVTRRNRIRNKQIRAELETISILDFTEDRQLSWWGHLQRMDSNKTVKQLWKEKIKTK